jgi:hypothetical protein
MGLRGSCEQKAASQCKVTSASFLSYVLRAGAVFRGRRGMTPPHPFLPVRSTPFLCQIPRSRYGDLPPGRTLKYSLPVIALGPSGRPVFTTTTTARMRAIAAAGRPTHAVFRKSVNLGSGAGSQMCFQERLARILFMFDVDMPKRSANALWLTLPFV